MPEMFDQSADVRPVSNDQPGASTVSGVRRGQPDTPGQRAALVTRKIAMIKAGKRHWEEDFKRMRRDQAYIRNIMWEGQTRPDEESQVKINLVQKHVRSRVAALYAKNPTVVAKRRQRRDFKLWDGTMASLALAQQTMQMSLSAGQPASPDAIALFQDVVAGSQKRRLYDNIAETVQIALEYYMRESVPSFKRQMKQLVRRVETNGVGYTRIGIQRSMQPSPQVELRMADLTNRIANLERMRADIADGQTDAMDSEVEEYRLELQSLQNEKMAVVREGLTFHFPRSTALIIDPRTEHINGWVGTGWMAEEFILTPRQIQAVTGVDVGQGHMAYTADGKTVEAGTRHPFDSIESEPESYAVMWELFEKSTGLRYWLVDGYNDFLGEPGAPDISVEQFYPFFALAFNEIENEKNPIPLSSVTLLRDVQQEYNRKNEAVRQHRIANRPLYMAPSGAFEDDEKKSMAEHGDHDIIFVQGLGENESVENKLKPVGKIPIDPNMYETASDFDNFQRISGDAEANIGGTSGATATESSIAETSRVSSLASNADDLDDHLSEVMRAAGQVLLMEIGPEAITEIVGDGAVWPTFSGAEIAKELWVEIEAGSSGRPNKAQELANFERVAPTLIQVPGISPEWLARFMLKLMDSNIDVTDALLANAPSIIAMNQAARPSTGDPATDPAQQGDNGGNNAERGQGAPGGPQPAFGPSGAI